VLLITYKEAVLTRGTEVRQVLVQVELERNLDIAAEARLEEGELGSVEVEDHELDLVSNTTRDAGVEALEGRLRELHPEGDLEAFDSNVVRAVRRLSDDSYGKMEQRIPRKALLRRVTLLVRLVEVTLLDLDVQNRLVVTDELQARLAKRSTEEELRKESD
jgi:hypothetical protein